MDPSAFSAVLARRQPSLGVGVPPPPTPPNYYPQYIVNPQMVYYQQLVPFQYGHYPPPPPPPPQQQQAPIYHHQHRQQNRAGGNRQLHQKHQHQQQQQQQQQQRGNQVVTAKSAPVVIVSETQSGLEQQLWYCEPCDKEFTQLSAYTAHSATHEKCQHPGCSYSGTRKVVSAHFLGAHGLYSGSGFTTIDVEGQKFEVLIGTSPDEVQQWRADRRKKFPTSATVMAKQYHLDQLQVAGGLPPLASGKAGKRSLGKDSGPTKVCDFFTRGRCKRGLDCLNLHDEELQKARKREKKRAREETVTLASKRKTGGLDLPPPLAGGVRGTLMKKLLEDKLTTEENICFQLFRYIVHSNFFRD